MYNLIIVSLFLVSSRITKAAFLAQSQSGFMTLHQHDVQDFREKRSSPLFQNNPSPSLGINQTDIQKRSLDFRQDSFLLQLPIFTLRKKVKFPTDEIHLNLYEPRFLALAERVLQQSEPYYGAIYCSHKPQMVTHGGMSPITPIVEPGDIGLLCEVYSSNKDISSLEVKKEKEEPQLGENITSMSRLEKRVQLSARGVSRFCVKKVLHKGYDNSNMKNTDDESLPYIVVEATLLEDDIISHDRKSQERIAVLFEKYSPKILEFVKDMDMVDSEMFYNSTKKDGQTVDNTRFARMVELITFVMASKLVDRRPAQEMLDLITMTSTLQRFEYVLRELRIL